MNYMLTQPLKGSENHFPLGRYASLVIKTTWLICSTKLLCRVGISPPTRFVFHTLICGVPRRPHVFPFQKFARDGNKVRSYFKTSVFVLESSHLHTWCLSPAPRNLRAQMLIWWWSVQLCQPLNPSLPLRYLKPNHFLSWEPLPA